MKRTKATEHKKGHFSTGGPLILTQAAQSLAAMRNGVRRAHAVKRMAAPVLARRKPG